MDDTTTGRGRRPSTGALLAAGTLGAVVLGLGGVAYAQTAEPTDPADPDAAVTQEQECEDGAAGGGADAPASAPTDDV